MNKLKLLLVIFLVFCFRTVFTYGQDSLIVRPGIHLPPDSLVRNQLLGSLNKFIRQKDQPNKENQYVLHTDLLYTSALLDEFKHMDSNPSGPDTTFYSAYIDNITGLADGSFIIQLSYMGDDKGKPLLRASFELLAKKGTDHYYFSSPMPTRTAYWKTDSVGNTIFHYKNKLDKTKAGLYAHYDSFYNEKLKIQLQQTEFYGADNFPEAMQILGVFYKIDYNGISYNSFTAFENNTFLRLSGTRGNDFPNFDPHDMWHEKLRMVVSAKLINRPVDEGCAYLYGGSWGFSWKQVLTAFESYAAANPSANWLDLYKNGTQFTMDRYQNGIANVINALIVQKLEKEKGFEAVMSLLLCGPREKGDANYFTALEKVSGISPADFNKEVWKLIQENK